jgi:hypothetical protein
MQKCKFFRWAGTSPSISPPATQIPTLPSSTPATTIAVNRLTSSGDVTCAHPHCQTVRLAPGCVNKWCRRHCRLLGNCDIISHTIGTSAPTTAVPADSSVGNFFASQGHGPSTAPSSTAPPALLAVPPPPRASTSALQTLDACPDPRFSSQMQDIFSTEWGVQQGLVASKREREAEQLENTRRANMEVTVHAQVKVNICSPFL